MAVSQRIAPIIERTLRDVAKPKGYEEMKRLLDEQRNLVSPSPRIYETPENLTWEKATGEKA